MEELMKINKTELAKKEITSLELCKQINFFREKDNNIRLNQDNRNNIDNLINSLVFRYV